MKILLDYDYPGNVRELKNVLEHAVILDGINPRRALPTRLPFESRRRRNDGIAITPGDVIAEAGERDAIRAALQSHGWNRTEAARALRINRTTLWRRMKKHKLHPSETHLMLQMTQQCCIALHQTNHD